MQPLGSSIPTKVMTDVAEFLDIPGTVKLSLSSPQANSILSDNKALAREINRLEIDRKWITTYESCSANKIQRHTLNSNVELGLKEIQIFLNSISKVKGDIYWRIYSINDEIANSLLRIEFKELVIERCRITASNVLFTKLLAQYPDKICTHNERELVYAQPSLLNDEAAGPIHCGCEGYVYLGIIGYQEMPAILQYYHRRTWIEWNTTLCNINNCSFLEFKDIFTEKEYQFNEEGEDINIPKFSISLERSSTSKIDNPAIPEELVDPGNVSNFKTIVQVVQTDIPIQSVVSAAIKLESLRIYREYRFEKNTITIEATFPSIRENHEQYLRIQRTNVDLRLSKEIVVKILKLCSCIDTFKLFEVPVSMFASSTLKYPVPLGDKFFSLLCEHSLGTEITNEWTMNIKLSEANSARLRENKSTPLLNMLKVKEAVAIKKDEVKKDSNGP